MRQYQFFIESTTQWSINLSCENHWLNIWFVEKTIHLNQNYQFFIELLNYLSKLSMSIIADYFIS